jgi:hypothetical protein
LTDPPTAKSTSSAVTSTGTIPHDRLDVLDLGRLEQHMADRDEQRALVDRLDDRLLVLADDHLEVGLCLVQVADGREVRALVDDAVAARVDREEAAEHDRLRDGDVLVHHRRARRPPDDPADLVADHHRRLPPALAPGADPSLAPHARVVRQTLLRAARHRGQRVVDQVRRVLEDRELGPVVEERAHEQQRTSPSPGRPAEAHPGRGCVASRSVAPAADVARSDDLTVHGV